MKVLCLVDGQVQAPDRWMWNHLSAAAQADAVDFLWASPHDRYPKWGKLLAYYPAYWGLALRAERLCRHNAYDLVVAWETKCGFPLAGLRALRGRLKPGLLTFAFAYKGLGLNAVPIGRAMVKGLTAITVPTQAEVAYYQQILGLPREQIHYVPLGGYEVEPSAPADLGRPYIFSGGRSDRDYGTLFSAMPGVPIQLVVNARKFNVRGLQPSSNVTVNEFMATREYHALMAGAQFIVVPLANVPHAAGIVHIVQAMSIGKAIVATRTSSTADYVQHGETGILTPPGDAMAMRDAITELAQNPERAKRMGETARQRFLDLHTSQAFAERNYAVMKQIASLT